MAALFAFTLFLSAALLFLIEPMFARMVLPRLGGSPAVWTTCLVFFQSALLAGYAYAHVLPGRPGLRRHALLHLALLLAGLLLLPVVVPAAWNVPADRSPVPALLGLLGMTVGVPFLLVAACSPLLQRWFAATDHPAAHDPYFLYGASNLGSLLALLAYPALVEPLLPLSEQTRWWSAGYLALVVSTAVCGVLLWLRIKRVAISRADAQATPPAVPRPSAPHTTWLHRLHWLVLAFVPSSLLVSVTTYLTTDIAPVPLLWVIPLALYLLTFILAFARRPWLSHEVTARVMPLVVLIVALAMLAEAKQHAWLLIPLHLAGLFVVSLVCHGELARRRPAAGELTGYYLCLSAGGALGGLFAAILAPLLFAGIAEYPLALVLACLLRPAPPSDGTPRTEAPAWKFSMRGIPVRLVKGDVIAPLLLGLVTLALVLVAPALGIASGPEAVAVLFAVPLIVCYTFLAHPIRFGLGIGALFLASLLYAGAYGEVLHRERSFFGVHRVTEQQIQGTDYRLLVNGTTVHGMQCLAPGRRSEPLTYYHKAGPIGQVFAARLNATTRASFLARAVRGSRPHGVGVVGLGAATLACYARPGEEWTFYEIDPTVCRITCDSGYFTFWQDCKAAKRLVLGDARRSLDEEREGPFEVLVLDAFSSDAIPVHLLTREALDLYARRLTEDGLLAFHISNDYLDLEPVLGELARERGWVGYAQTYPAPTATPEERQAELEAGRYATHWVILARKTQDLLGLDHDSRWHPVRVAPGSRPWTDDFSNLLGVFSWFD